MKQAEFNLTVDQRSAVPLYEQICQQIRAKIESRQLQPGAPLPTNHELRDRLQVNYKTAQQAMATLAREGYVTRQARRGTIVKGIPRRGVVGIYTWVELFGQDSKHEYYRLVTSHLSRQLAGHGRVYRMYLGSGTDDTSNTAFDDLLRHLSGGTLCGVLFAPPPPQWEKLVEYGRSARVPVVSLVTGAHADYSVTIDYPAVMQIMAKHLISQGRRRIAFIYNRDSLALRDPEKIAGIFEKAGCPSKPSWIIPGTDTEQGGYEAAGRLPLNEIDGLMLMDDVMCLGVDRRLHEMNVSVPRNLMAATMWNEGSRLQLTLPFERFEVNIENEAAMALQLLQDAIKGQRIRNPHQKIVLVQKQTQARVLSEV